MPQERRFTDRKIFKLGALAAGPFLLAACQNTSGEQKTPLTQTPQITSDQHLATTEPILQPINTEAPQKTATRIPTSTSTPEISTPEIISSGNFAGYLSFKDKGYSYTMYPDMNLNRLLGKTEAGEPNNWDILLFMKENGYINPQSADDIRSLLTEAKQAEPTKSPDSVIIKNVNSAANILNAHCFDHDNNGTFPKGFMNGLASYVYHKKPQDWPTNKRVFIQGNCFWGEKTAP